MIGLINYFQADNYGAVLQSYALQRTISELGFDSENIDYQCDYINERYALLHFDSMYQLLSDICYFKDHLSKKYKFEKFRSKYLQISKERYDQKNIWLANEHYDLFITGSDQVFNYTNTNFDKTYFLDFVNNADKKFSYAGSFGISSIPKDYEDEYRKLLTDFSRLSFREKTGVDIYRNLMGIDAEVACVLDPTLIAPMECWNFEEKYETPQKYILVYMLERSAKMINFVKILQEKTGYDVVYIGSLTRSHRQGMNADYRGDIAPQEFVELFKNADYIVTNSFHGTAFSIIFEKTFFVEKLKGNTCTNDRFTSLLSQIGLESRIIELNDNMDINFKDQIDYVRVTPYLERLKKFSKDYLGQILCGGK